MSKFEYFVNYKFGLLPCILAIVLNFWSIAVNWPKIWSSSLFRGDGTQDLYIVINYVNTSNYDVKLLGSGPDRGRSPVEWEQIMYVRPYVTFGRPSDGPWDPSGRPLGPFGRPSSPFGCPAGLSGTPQTPLAGSLTPLAGHPTHSVVPQTLLAGPQTPLDRRMEWRSFFPFYRTLSPIGAAALLTLWVFTPTNNHVKNYSLLGHDFPLFPMTILYEF